MNILDFLMPALVVGLLAVVRQLRLYPASWDKREYVYAARYRAARGHLQRHRRRMRSVEDGEQQAVEALKRRLARSTDESDDLVRSLTAQRDRLGRPPLGAPLAEDFGNLRLYKHYLQFLRETADAAPVPHGDPLRLARISVDVDLHAKENCYINVTTPERKHRSAVYPRGGRYKERDVHAFYLRIDRQMSYDEEFDRGQAEEEADLTARIGQIKAEKEGTRQTLLRQIEERVEAQRTAPERLKAEEEWEKARQEWANETGRFPALRVWPRR